jgi:hypothetical protein
MKQFIERCVNRVFPPAMPMIESPYQFEGALRIEWLIAMTSR